MENLMLLIDKYGFLIASVLFFVLGVVLFVVFYQLQKSGECRKGIPPILWLTAGAALALFFLNLESSKIAWGNGWNAADRIGMAIMQTLSNFGGERGAGDTREALVELLGESEVVFFIYAYLLHLVASGVIVLLIFKMITKFFPRWTYLYLSRGQLYIFSGASEREVLLAEDIRKMELQKEIRKSVIVFLDSTEEGLAEVNLSERIRAITQNVFHDTVESFSIPKRYYKKHIDFFLLKEMDSENINDALLLAERYEKLDYDDICIHILSDNSETEYLLDAVAGKSNCDFRLISETKSMIYQLLDQKPLFLGQKDGALEILIIGAGRTGQEATKICSWCGYTKELTPNIWLIDKLEEPVWKLEKECAEMMEQSNICYRQIDVETPAFLDFLREHRTIGYVICALGDEHLNMRIALDVRKVAYEEGPYDEESKKLPIINVLLNDEVLYTACEELSFGIGAQNVRSYGLNAFGSFKEFYTWKNMGNSYLEGGAMSVHRFYNGEGKAKADFYDTYRKSNYNRDSSMAAGLHSKYKAYAILHEILHRDISDEEWMYAVGGRTQTEQSQADEQMRQAVLEYLYDVDIEPEQRAIRVEELAELEHKRWNAYMRSIGWRTASKAQALEWKPWLNNAKNFPAKMQPNLVAWDELGEGTKEYDRNLIWNLPFIMKEAAEYDESVMEKKVPLKVEAVDMGNYTENDFEASCFWHNYKNVKGKEIHLYGPVEKLCAYVKQALLLQTFADGYSTCHVYYAKEDESRFSGFKLWEQEGYELPRQNIVFHSGYKWPVKKNEQGIDNEYCDLNLPCKYTQVHVLELKASLIATAKLLNDMYNKKQENKPGYKKIEWSELSAFVKGSNICAASFIQTHQRNFKAGMPFEEMAAVEHDRWSIYHILHGWTVDYVRDASGKIIAYEEIKDAIDNGIKPVTKNQEKKKHICLVSYAQLDKLSAINDYKQNDRDNVRQVLHLIREEK